MPRMAGEMRRETEMEDRREGEGRDRTVREE